MLTDDELLALYRDLESDRVERKESVAHIEAIRHNVCAFANDLPRHGRPGVLFIGQRNDGTCAGLAITDQLLQQLGGIQRDVTPFPVLVVRKVTLDGCTVVAMVVEPVDNPPARTNGRIWVRVGPRLQVATAEDERLLVEKRRWGNLPFDAHPVQGATRADLDLPRIQNEYLPSVVSPEALSENGRPLDQQMRALRLIDRDGTPTAAGILLMGSNPRGWFPGAYVQFLRVDGTALTDSLVDQHEISGTLTDQIRQVEEILRLNITKGAVIGGARRSDHVDYPEDALRQIIRNALMHRTYEGTNAPVRVTWFSDRVEIQNPGGPYGQVTVDAFGSPGVADYRNPTIAESLKLQGYVEKFGVGIELARKSLLANGNPPLEYRVDPSHVAAILRRLP